MSAAAGEPAPAPASDPPEIHKYVVISTAHLPAKWFVDKELPDDSLLFDYGMMLWVPDDIDDDREGEPEYAPCNDADIVRVRRFARALGCDFVRLDGDGPVVDLPTFEW